MGFVVDALAVATPIVEAGELDQNNMTARSIFGKRHAVLVRSDLFATMEGLTNGSPTSKTFAGGFK